MVINGFHFLLDECVRVAVSIKGTADVDDDINEWAETWLKFQNILIMKSFKEFNVIKVW